ncbi:ATP-binding protein [Massilia sp. GCM10020059]|uniref:histidine kinase n=1 Tax=Massilia agrisoli TaxID=2892444 RepID=A0ABS8IXQ1_9BURK|nr:ATP-binding protein [Massilia agrisoli]MCC6073397.1 response regulator [Massilia agrisoli]
MGTLHDVSPGSTERSFNDDAAAAAQDPQARIAALTAEVSALRQALEERNALEGMVAQLREANENLVFATLNAQGLRDDAEAANRRQNEFLAMLAHELRNPLAPINMAAALLERIPAATPQLLNLTQVIGRQVDHMSHLLDDLLDAARISSGKITLTVQPVSLADVLAQAVETVEPRIAERRQSLVAGIPDAGLIIDGDPVRLTQAFSNLLGNASKYTGDLGEVRLSVAQQDGFAIIKVSDNGTGIAADVIPHIFDLFTQGPRSLARSEGGLGVGLNVVRNLISMHGGTVVARSEGIGHGSEFTVTLPVSAQAKLAAPPVEAGEGAASRCRVLLVEDNVDACTTLTCFLEIEGHVVSTAYDGVAGLASALQGGFDVLVCDIGLPGMDGFALIAELRRAAQGQRAYAIALSGYGQEEDRARAIEAGFDAYLVKPVSPAALLAAVAAAGS